MKKNAKKSEASSSPRAPISSTSTSREKDGIEKNSTKDLSPQKEGSTLGNNQKYVAGPPILNLKNGGKIIASGGVYYGLPSFVMSSEDKVDEIAKKKKPLKRLPNT